jgi:hypothetical protein
MGVQFSGLGVAVSAPARSVVRELDDCIPDPAPDRDAVVIVGGRELSLPSGRNRQPGRSSINGV